ncbi:TonB-dependent receptor [Pseudocnuella soli]|uniref:TonB-dependent receptor n=1 Tax=Pseudocnuella soli TaxID=2502779 RepID=UPI001404C455|nr:TonB-dependent receptor [Pseudocnuella soli]
MKVLFALCCSLMICTSLYAQNGTLAGRILDGKTNTPMAGVTVTIAADKSKASDLEGRYLFNLPAGTYSISFRSVGYNTKTISDVVVKANSTEELNIVMEQQAQEMAGVVVTASSRRESVASMLTLQRNNAAISDGISIEAIRKSPDRNIGEVLKRVSGTSIQDDKFVVVRGLSDRYNVALINGALLPSTEPDRRAFSFDIVPSNLIDNILINKTASPDLPGDFSGGIVQVMTKDIPFRNFLNVQVGGSYNSISTGKRFDIGLLEATDYLGFDNGTRALPGKFPSRRRYLSYNADATADRRIAASRIMRNNYGSRYDGNALPGLNFQANWGGRKELNNGGTLGAVLALIYRNSQSIQFNERRDYQTPDKTELTPGNLFFNYRDTQYSFNTNIGVLANFAYKKGNTKIVLKNIVNRLFENNNLVRSGTNYDNQQIVNANAAIAVEKSLISSQLEGEHLLSNRNDRLRWNVNYGLTMRNQPDYRVLPYAKSLSEENNKAEPMKIVLRDTYRFWSELLENAFGANVNYSIPVTFGGQKQTFKAGGFAQYKVRDFSTRIFRYEQASSTLNPALPSLPPTKIFNDGNIYREGFVLGEITNNTDKYDATSGLYAGYAMIDGRIAEKLRAVYGVRVEAFNFNVNTADFSGQAVTVNRNYLDVLPSLNLTYNLTAKSNLRFSASRTVSRPEFREVANFAYFDFVRNAQLKGNTDLKRSQNTNLDLRFETYAKAGEVISGSVFYKHFKNPIEQVVVNGSTPSNLLLSYTNPNAATTYGVEVEVRKNLGFVGASWMENLMFNLNAAYMKSKVDFNENSNPFDPARPLQGLSPWLFNAGLQYALPENKVTFSALVNRIGQRIAAVGFQGYPDIYENGRTVVDVQTAVKVLKGKGEVKLNLSDLLNQRAVFYQNVDPNDSRAYNKGTDRVQYSFLYGRNISVGFTYNFQ